MNKSFFQTTAIISIVLFLLQACSAGGGETGTGENDPPVVPGDSSVSVGVITGFGSVFVNGVEYETTADTTVSLDGNTSLESNLAVGMLVTISGNVNADGTTGDASSISFEDNVEGMVLENSLATGGVLNVLGQIIVVDNETVFHSDFPSVTIIEEVTVNQVVEVSGYSNGDGNIYATRIELKREVFTDGEEIEIKGTVKNVVNSTFTIGNMTVRYTAESLSGFDSNVQSDVQLDDFVSVKSKSGLNIDDELVAYKVELKETSSISGTIETNKEVEFEGVVSQVNSITNSFVLNTETILVDDNTEFENSKSFADLADKVRVKISGTVNESGEIVAKEVNIKQVSFTYIEGEIEAISLADNTITVLGVVIQLNNSTRLKDDLDGVDDEARQYFNFLDLAMGDNVEVSAYTDSLGNFIASKLERENAEDTSGAGEAGERELEGLVTAVRINATENIIVVSGVEIDVETLGFNGQVGDIVELHIKIFGGVWVATEISINDDESEFNSDSKSDSKSESDSEPESEPETES